MDLDPQIRARSAAGEVSSPCNPIGKDGRSYANARQRNKAPLDGSGSRNLENICGTMWVNPVGVSSNALATTQTKAYPDGNGLADYEYAL